MLDPLTYLSFSMYENKNVYALLVGSGVSRAAQIPTGWEITLDLVRRVARAEGVEGENNWHAWYRSTQGKDPNYSDLLDQLATTPDERRSILHSYIEPTAEEAEEGKKIPTAAHRAIATMIRDGFVRVIVTTNFDRLLENAMRDVGVEPTVISSEDSLAGAVPLIHSRCHVIKLHGDYLDTRIKNTEAELSGYSDPMNQLLDRVLDEHGLIICGWSGDWDFALRSAIVRAPNRRYPLFWASRGKPSPSAQDIINHRHGRLLPIESADAFFDELADKLQLQAQIARPDPRSVDLLVASVKRYLSGPQHRIQLTDLLGDELRRAREKLDNADFHAKGPVTADEFRRRIDRYEAIAEPLVRLLSILGRWGAGSEFPVALEVLRELCKPNASEGTVIWISLSAYPAVLALYGYGLGALHGERYGEIFTWLSSTVRAGTEKEKPAVRLLFLEAWRAGFANLWQQYPGLQDRRPALSDHLRDLCKSFTKDYSPAGADFDFRFDLFEFLGSMAHLSLNEASGDRERLDELHARGQYLDVPVGGGAYDPEARERVIAKLRDTVMYKTLLNAGFAGGDGDRYFLLTRNLELAVGRLW